jgi:mono/diheme cytochrome c family protein
MVLLVVVMSLAGVLYVKSTGLRGQPEPGALEASVAGAFRALAVPSDVKTKVNPLGASSDAVRPGMEHFARYCAVCHANDGSGRDTPFGRGLYPKPPDLSANGTQDMSDGEIFYIIENGVRFTGMPAFGSGSPDPEGEKLAWQLVAFIRHLPRITSDETDEMKTLNPL